MSEPIRVGMGQMLVQGARLRENLDRAERMIDDAAAQGCQIVVLPECLDLGWTHSIARQLAQPIPGSASDALCRAAAQSQIYVVAGLTERADDRIYNAALLISPDGRILRKHRKINLLEQVEDLYAVGDSLAVVQTALGTIGVNICADNFPDSLALGHSLARMGAQVLLSPCAWAVPPDYDPVAKPYGDLWEDAYTALARLYEIPVIGVSHVGCLSDGPWKGWKCIGCSLAVDARGEVRAKAPYGEAAECLEVVQLVLAPPIARGTGIAEMLARKGYCGP